MEYSDFRNLDREKYHSKFSPPKFILEYISKTDRILDFGCGFALMVEWLNELGYQCQGVDIDIGVVDLAKQLKLPVELGTVDLNPFNHKFDVITLSHVIEHFPKDNIIPFLRLIIKNYLREEGKLIIMVPNAQSFTGTYWAYEDFTHSTLFTTGSIASVLRSAGLSRIEYLDLKNHRNRSFPINIIRYMSYYALNYFSFLKCKLFSTSYHLGSPNTYGYEIKVLAKR